MGMTFSLLFDEQYGKEKIQILMFGLATVGKTTILEKLQGKKEVNLIPTIGITQEILEFKNFKLTVLDLGDDQERLRPLWRHSYPNTNGLIFVVDSSDKDKIEIAGEELKLLLDEKELQEIAVLILANKQDISEMSLPEIAERLNLHGMKRQWKIQGTCAITGEGLQEGLDWLNQIVNK